MLQRKEGARCKQKSNLTSRGVGKVALAMVEVGMEETAGGQLRPHCSISDQR